MNLMDFITYPKINNNLNYSLNIKDAWVATEKLHGAHFLTKVQDQKVSFGKRKTWLEIDDSFFGWQLIRDSIQNQALSISKEIDNQNIIIYGELIGGHYPHPDVTACIGLSAIQTGIWYSPKIHWVIFDILILSNNEHFFLANNEIERLAKELSFLIAPVIQRGKLTEIQSAPVKFQTKLPNILGLPQLENNFAEGIVVKPDFRCKLHERPIVKYKIPEFDELKFNLSSSYEPKILSFEEGLNIAKTLINIPRFASARSKVGIVKNLIMDEVVLDIMIVLEFAFKQTCNNLSLKDQNLLMEEIRKNVEVSFALNNK